MTTDELKAYAESCVNRKVDKDEWKISEDIETLINTCTRRVLGCPYVRYTGTGDVYVLQIHYNGIDWEYPFFFDGKNWVTTIDGRRFLTPLASCYDDVPVAYANITPLDNAMEFKRRRALLLHAYLKELPYPVLFKVQDKNLVKMWCEGDVLNVKHNGMTYCVNLRRGTEFEWDIDMFLKITHGSIPVEYTVLDDEHELIFSDYGDRIKTVYSSGDMSLYIATVDDTESILWVPATFMAVTDGLKKDAGQSFVEMLDMYCALNQHMGYSESIRHLLDEAGCLRKVKGTLSKILRSE